MNLYAKDPKDNTPSVSLTILWISVVYLLTLGVLQVLGKVTETGIAMEFFGMSSALYFGRRVQFTKGSANLQTDNTQESK